MRGRLLASTAAASWAARWDSWATWATRVAWVACLSSTASCGPREQRSVDPTFRDVVAPLLSRECAGCHQGDAPAGGWRATSYVDVIGCLPDGSSAIGGAEPPILRALSTPTHAGVAGASDVLRRWIAAGAKASSGNVHPPEFFDPRSSGSHAKVLRGRRYAQMLDASDPMACGTCHVGAPNHAPGALGADRATACTSCHAEDKGVLACTTCHGDKAAGRAYPPRAACFAPEARPDTSHAAHLNRNEVHPQTFDCATCHPTPTDGAPTRTHADGYVEVFEVGWDASTRSCTNGCHARRDGQITRPVWNESKMTCNACHGAPPKDHYKGKCSACHRDVDDAGDKLTSLAHHFDGRVDLGDGSGKCGACHGAGDDPWPTTGAHGKHKAPAGAAPVACATCHAVPTSADKHPEGKGSATVRLSGLAAATDLAPAFDPTTKGCSAVYCHAGKLGGTVSAPTWTQGATASACGACHSMPPPAPHTTATGCGAGGFCHAGLVDAGKLTPDGVAKHVNGSVELR